MEFFISPWFGALSILSLIVMTIVLWGVARACKRHNASAIGCLCGKGAQFPNTVILTGIVAYVLFTVSYIFIPPIIHDLVL